MNTKPRQTYRAELANDYSKRVVKTLWSNIQTEKQTVKVKTEDLPASGRDGTVRRAVQ